jgi:hypothetical protein
MTVWFFRDIDGSVDEISHTEPLSNLDAVWTAKRMSASWLRAVSFNVNEPEKSTPRNVVRDRLRHEKG